MVKKMSLAALLAMMLIHVGQTEAKWLSKSFGGPISPVHSTLNDHIGRYRTNIDAFNNVLKKAIDDAQSTKDKKELFLAFTAPAGGFDSGKTILYMLAEKGNANGINLIVTYLTKNSGLFTPEELKGYTTFASLEEMAHAKSPEPQTPFDAPEGENALLAAAKSSNPNLTVRALVNSGWFTAADAFVKNAEGDSASKFLAPPKARVGGAWRALKELPTNPLETIHPSPFAE